MKIGDQDWKLVPVEATEEMLDRLAEPAVTPGMRQVHREDASDNYSAGIAAAPQPDIESMVEDLGRVIYDSMYASQGGIWAANESKDVWYRYARAVLRHLFGEG